MSHEKDDYRLYWILAVAQLLKVYDGYAIVAALLDGDKRHREIERYTQSDVESSDGSTNDTRAEPPSWISDWLDRAEEIGFVESYSIRVDHETITKYSVHDEILTEEAIEVITQRGQTPREVDDDHVNTSSKNIYTDDDRIVSAMGIGDIDVDVSYDTQIVSNLD